MVLDIILVTIATLAIIEGAFIFFMPKATKKIMLSFTKAKLKKIQSYGIIELIFGIILIILAIIVRGS